MAEELDFISYREINVPERNLNEKLKKRLCLIIIRVFFKHNLDRHELIKAFNMSRDEVTNILHCDIEKVSLDSIIECLEKMSALDPLIDVTIKRLELV